MKPVEKTRFWFEGFVLDLKRGCVWGEQGEIDLRPKSFEVLRYLVENAGRLVPKDELIKAVWPNVIVTDESLARCISDVRLALHDQDQQIVKTVPRRGYMLAASVSDQPLIAPPGSEFPAEAGLDLGATASHGPPDRASRAPAAAERRPLTVMACEFVGLAALSARVDPEDSRVAAAVCHKSCAEIVERHHGHVARYLDDGLLVYFGYPHASEHDTEHAVRAGLALLGSMARPHSGGYAPLQVRIGIATGTVVVAGETAAGGAAERIAVGETPHLARRLQLAAEPGNVVIDQATRRLAGGLFEYRDLGFVVLEGYSETIQAWRVLKPSEVDSRFEARRGSVATRFDPGPPGEAKGGGLTPFVGRTRELQVLTACLAESSKDVKIVDIVGEPGIGKSRLLHEFRSRLTGSTARWCPGSCWPDDGQLPYRPFIQVVRHTFRLAAGDSEADVISKLDTGLKLLGLATVVNLGLLLNLLGMKPPAGALRGLDDVLVGLRTRELLVHLVREAGRLAPIVIALEDLHWIDGASQDLLAGLIDTSTAGALTIIHTRRPDYRPPWIGSPNTTTLSLEPLAASETSRIVQARLGVPELTGELSRLILDRAEGNPLFAEEIANFLIEGKMVQRRAVGLEYDAAAVAAALPASVQSLLTTRVDRLSPRDRELLQAASVIGRRFAADLLAAVTSTGNVAARLQAMEALDLIRRDHDSDEYVFKHVLVRDALYAGLLSGPRQTWHLSIAREIEHRNESRLSEVAEALAHHYSRADHKDKAVEYLALVGKKSLGIYSLDEAEHFLRAALDLARSKDRERTDAQVARIMVDLAVVLYLQFRSGDTIGLIEPELARIDALGDIKQVPILLDLYGIALFTHCRFREGRQIENKALAMAERLGDGRSRAHARAGVIMLSIYVDPMPLADFDRFAQRAFREAEEGDDTYIIGRMIMAITMNYMNRGLIIEGRQWALRLMELGRGRQDRRSLGMALWLLGWLDILAEDYGSALRRGEQCMETAFAPFDRQIGANVIGISQMLLGRLAEGIETIEQHRRQATAQGWLFAALGTEAPLGVAMLLRGDLKKGARFLETVIERCESEYGYQAYADWARIFLAEFYLALAQGAKKTSLRTVLKNFLFLAKAKPLAARKAESLLQIAVRNRQFSDRGTIRARIDYDLGVLYKGLGRLDLARKHLCDSRAAAVAQEATAIVARIDAAMSAL